VIGIDQGIVAGHQQTFGKAVDGALLGWPKKLGLG
jgi:hypothetical protein